MLRLLDELSLDELYLAVIDPSMVESVLSLDVISIAL